MFAQSLENALVDAIKDHNLETATSLIELIKKSKAASLYAINNNRENFLHIALRKGATDIFELLYKSIKGGDKTKSYLSKPDSQGNSLFKLALELDNPRVAITLFTDFENASSLGESIEVFFRENKAGDTPLHYAAAMEEPEPVDKNELTLFDFILGKIHEADALGNKSNQVVPEVPVKSASYVSKNPAQFASDVKPVDIRLIQVNKKGESALHLAASKGLILKATRLINAGVSPFLKNKKGKTALDVLENTLEKIPGKKPEDDKLVSILPSVFNALKPTMQQEILVYYRNKLLANSEDEALKELYFTLAGMISLVVLMNAQLEFNKKIPIKTGLPVEFLFWEEMPDTHRKKVFKAEKELGIVRDDSEFTVDNKKVLNKEALIDLLIDLKRSLEDVQARCKALDAVPSFKESFNHSSLKEWSDSREAVSGAIVVSGTLGAMMGLPLAIGLALGIGMLMGTWIIPVILLGSIFGGALVGALVATVFYAVVKGINLYCQEISHNLAALFVSDILNQISSLSSKANWPESVATPLGRLVEQVNVKEEIDVNEATRLLNLTHHLIEELPTINFLAVDTVKKEALIVDEKAYDEEPTLMDVVRLSK